MTPRPVVGSVAEHVYSSLEPGGFTAHDEENDWALLHYVHALCLPFQLVYDLAGEHESDLSGTRDFLTGPVHPGWSIAVDLDRAPDYLLPWLAQAAGVKLGRSMDATEQRQAIRDRRHRRRGRVDAIIAAAQEHLTGTKTVYLRERYRLDTGATHAYHFSILTMDAETPDPALVEAAILAVKPAGLKLHYDTRTGQTWATVDNDTWATVDNDTWATIAGTT